jgi:hypothetical protein
MTATPPMGFTRISISTAETGVESAVFVDLDGDSDIDIVSSTDWNSDISPYPFTEIVWFENDGSQTFSRHTIANTAYVPYYVFAINLDQDGNTYTIICLYLFIPPPLYYLYLYTY